MEKENARPSITAESSATVQGVPIVATFSFPAKLDAVCAEALCRLLSGERLTGLDAVSEASTTRLAAHVHYLKEAYACPIESIEKANGCKDGRVTFVSEYFMPRPVILQAMAKGAASWCAKVKAARLKLRANAANAKRQADKANQAAAKPASRQSSSSGATHTTTTSKPATPAMVAATGMRMNRSSDEPDIEQR